MNRWVTVQPVSYIGIVLAVTGMFGPRMFGIEIVLYDGVA